MCILASAGPFTWKRNGSGVGLSQLGLAGISTHWGRVPEEQGAISWLLWCVVLGTGFGDGRCREPPGCGIHSVLKRFGQI